MQKANSILKNSAFLMCGKLGFNLLTFFNTVIITRHLGPQNYGKYTFVISIVTMAAVLWNFGLGVLLTRDVSRQQEKASDYADGVIIIKSFLAFIVIGLMAVTLKALKYDYQTIQFVIIFSLASYLTSISAIFNSVFSAFRRMEFNSLVSLLRPAFLFIALSVIVSMSGGVGEILFCQLLASFLICIVSYIFVRKFARPRLAINFSLIVDLLKNGAPFLLISAVHIVLYKIDHIMIPRMVGDDALGLYGAAYTLLEIIITFFPMLIVTSAYPVLSDLYKNDRESMVSVFHVLFKNLLVIGIPASCGIVILGNEIITFIYGNEYIEAGILLSILGCSIWMSFISLLMAWTLTAMDRQRTVLFINFVFMIVNIGTNLYAIPKYGAIGAAVTTCICNLGSVTILLIFLFKDRMRFVNWLEALKIVSCSMIMVATIFLIKTYLYLINDTIQLFTVISVSVAVYFGAALLLNLMQKNELKMLLR